MSNIEQNLEKILASRYGKDVRQSIHDSIHDCYEDGKAGAIDLIARQQIANLVANEGNPEKDSELIDIRIGYDGTNYTSAGEAIRSQAQILNEYIDNYYDLFTEGETVLNMHWQQGYWWSIESGDYGATIHPQNYVACKHKIVGDGTRLRAIKVNGLGISLYVCVYSSDGEFENGYQYGNTELNILLEKDKQYSFSIYCPNGIDPSFADSNYPFTKYISPSNIYYIGENREFTTLKEGIEEACKHENSIVIVDGGIYDIIQEYGSSYFEDYSYDPSDCGIVLKNNVHVIFSSKARVVCNYIGNNEDVMFYFSPFNVGEKGFKLENLSIEASRVRYCVHDDLAMFGNSHEFTKTEYQNCNMYLDNSENTARESYNCIGGGLPYNGEIIINGCIFESTASGEKYGGVDYHQNGESGAKSNSVITNCYFKGSMDRYSCSNLGQTQEKSTIIVTNCSCGRTEGYSNNPEYSNSIEFINWNNVRRRP